ncbi:FAP100 [Symbiodinium sp. CCMP2456]|nr:FAP100 [Symbiodinium sp. CCMP2456]
MNRNCAASMSVWTGACWRRRDCLALRPCHEFTVTSSISSQSLCTEISGVQVLACINSSVPCVMHELVQPHPQEEDNPFKLPPDDQIFAIREKERQRRAEEREKVKQQHVWEKVTSASRISRTRRVDDGIDDTQVAAEAARKARSDPRTEGLPIGRDARREKENIADFVAKKREMFLVQMSLDVKKAEILKLDARAKDKEEALNKSKQMLDKDVERFDTFLSTNDSKAHAAMKNADETAKQKQERVGRIKSLKSQLSAIQSEIAKHREQKDECLRFKDFLVNLTPGEWKEQKREEKKQRKHERRRIAVDARMEDIEERMQAEIEAEEQAFKEKEEKEKKGRRRQKKTEEDEQKEREAEARRKRIARKYPTRDQVDMEYVEYSSGEEMPLYFQEPKQLLDIFTSLEESNLFLIQNSQDTEQALEELDQKFAAMRKTREAMSNKMKLQIGQLERQITDEKSKCDELKQRPSCTMTVRAISQKHGGSEIEDLLEKLGEGVQEVHSICTHENQDDGDTLQMLARIESKLEEYLAYLDEAEESGLGARVLAEEHKKERQRRLDLRMSRKLHQEKKIEDRLKASLHRSQAPVHKKVGKQIMFRSAPLFQARAMPRASGHPLYMARRVVQEDDGYEEAVREHNIFGIWLDKEGVPNAQQPDP